MFSEEIAACVNDFVDGVIEEAPCFLAELSGLLELCAGGLFAEVSEETCAVFCSALDHVEGDLGASFGFFPILFPEVGESDEIIGSVFVSFALTDVGDEGGEGGMIFPEVEGGFQEFSTQIKHFFEERIEVREGVGFEEAAPDGFCMPKGEGAFLEGIKEVEIEEFVGEEGEKRPISKGLLREFDGLAHSGERAGEEAAA